MTVSAVVLSTENVATPEPFVVPETGVIVDEPAPCPIVTTWAATGLPKASRAVTVTVADDVPSAVTEPGAAATVDCTALTAPEVNVTEAVCVTVSESVVSVAV